MKKYIIVIMIIVLSFGVISFGEGPDLQKVGYVHDDVDGSFNVMTRDGLERADGDFEFITNEYICESYEEYNDKVDLAAQENDMVILVGFLFGEALVEVAPNYPDVKFVSLDFVGYEDEELNIVSNSHAYTFKEHEGSFLVGILAALESKNDEMGFVGGMDFYLINKFECGFTAGVKTINNKANVHVDYADAFNDMYRGFCFATKQHELMNADVIYHAAGGTGTGVIESAEMLDYWAIGVDCDQSGQSLDHVLCSMIKKVDTAAYLAVESLIDNVFEGGAGNVLGIAEDGVDYSDGAGNVRKRYIKMVDEYKQKISDEEIVVPENYDELESYLEGL
ncbi:MAG: BMP family ABC transporter substrate-binding protein [Bacillota bacterium]|nr:BMP family ABC transporter substrate-binding protein [Bacillota bacterium]